MNNLLCVKKYQHTKNRPTKQKLERISAKDVYRDVSLNYANLEVPLRNQRLKTKRSTSNKPNITDENLPSQICLDKKNLIVTGYSRTRLNPTVSELTSNSEVGGDMDKVILCGVLPPPNTSKGKLKLACISSNKRNQILSTRNKSTIFKSNFTVINNIKSMSPTFHSVIQYNSK